MAEFLLEFCHESYFNTIVIYLPLRLLPGSHPLTACQFYQQIQHTLVLQNPGTV